jgi:hypothetical protein
MEHNANCNCCECLWERITVNQRCKFLLKRGRLISYQTIGNNVEWITIEATQEVLFKQSRKSICESINARINNYRPSDYTGSAKSYKWALLNDNRIWK